MAAETEDRVTVEIARPEIEAAFVAERDWTAWQADPVLRLPPGTWEIRAEPAFSLSAECSMPAPNVHPSITIEVVP